MNRSITSDELTTVQDAIKEQPGCSAEDIRQRTGKNVLNYLGYLFDVYMVRDAAGVDRYYYDDLT